jgi:large subunit ribosomal protein L4
MSAQKKMNNKVQTHNLAPITQSDLGLEVVNRDIASAGVSIYIRQLLQNWRQGTVGVKDRSEVNKTNKKPWKQKGTGRARAGSARSPLWRGGGVTFGPQPRVRTLKVSKKLRKGILNTIFCNFLDNQQISTLPWDFNGDAPKTSHAYNLLKQAHLVDKKIVLFVSMNDVLAYSSFINIPNVQVLLFDEVNAFDLMNGKHWVVLQKDLPVFKEMVSKWL